MPLPDNSRCSALASDVPPSPGAPFTLGTTAAKGPSGLMLPVVEALAAAAAGAAAATACFAGPGARVSACAPSPLPWAPTPAGCAAALATADWPRVASHEAKEFAALPAMDCATAGVSAAHGSLEPPEEAISSPVTRLTRLPVGSVTSQM